MRKRHFRIKPAICLLFVGVLLTMWNTGCRSEGGNNQNAGTENLPAATAGTEQQPEVNPLQWAEDQLGRAKENRRRMDALRERLAALSEQVAGVPAASRQKATDFDELDAQLEGYREKCDFLRDEADEVIRQLEGSLSGERKTEGVVQDAGVDMRQKLEEHESTLADFDAAFDALDRAVEKLKNSRGKPVRLFGE